MSRYKRHLRAAKASRCKRDLPGLRLTVSRDRAGAFAAGNAILGRLLLAIVAASAAYAESSWIGACLFLSCENPLNLIQMLISMKGTIQTELARLYQLQNLWH